MWMTLFLFFSSSVSMVTSEPLVMDPLCPDGWYEPSSKKWKGTCFYFYTGKAYGDLPVTYEDARSFCQEQGTTLMTFKDDKHLTTFIQMIDNYKRPIDLVGFKYSFWIGYSSMYKAGQIFAEGVSINWTELSTMNTSKFATTYEGITLGDAGVAMIVEEVPGVTSGENWHMVPKNVYDIAKSLDKSRGFICAKDRGTWICGKWRNPYVSTFDGRKVKLEPHSHYWLFYSPPFSGVMIETSGPSAMAMPKDEEGNKPPSGLPIRQVEFWCFTNSDYNVSNVTVPAKNMSWILSKNSTDGRFQITEVNSGKSFPISVNPGNGDQLYYYIIVENGLVDKIPDPPPETNTDPPSWWTGEIYVYPFTTSTAADGYKSVVVSTPYFTLVWDGEDIQVEVKTSKDIDDKLSGLCYKCTTDKNNDFLPVGTTEVEKTQKLHLFSRGTVRYPQFSPTISGKPLACRNYVLHEAALETCRPLIDPIGPLALGQCLHRYLLDDKLTGDALKSLTTNIYQSCVWAVCSYGVQARCYYFEKLLNRFSSLQCTSSSVVQSTLSKMECSKTVYCPKSNLLNATSANATNKWTMVNGQCLINVNASYGKLHAEKACNTLGGHVVVPHNEVDVDQLFKYLGSNETITGVLTSSSKNVTSIYAYRKFEVLDGEDLVFNLTSNITNVNDEAICIYASKGKFTKRRCNYIQPATVTCSSMPSIANTSICSESCRFPFKCENATKQCVDPCPTGYESVSGCISFS